MRMLKDFRPSISLRCALMLLVFVPICVAQKIEDVDEAACRKVNGIWVRGTHGVPGDGTSHVKIAAPAPAGHELLGGHAIGFRQLVDENWSFTCKMNVVSGASSKERECDSPGNDMTIEQCVANSAGIVCEYVNAKNAPPKFVEVEGCYKQ